MPWLQTLLQSYSHQNSTVQFSCSVMSCSATPWTAARQASLSINKPQSLLKLMLIESVMPSNHLILCHSLLLLPSNFPSIRVFSSESVLLIGWSKYWSFSFNTMCNWHFRHWIYSYHGEGNHNLVEVMESQLSYFKS